MTIKENGQAALVILANVEDLSFVSRKANAKYLQEYIDRLERENKWLREDKCLCGPHDFDCFICDVKAERKRKC